MKIFMNIYIYVYDQNQNYRNLCHVRCTNYIYKLVQHAQRLILAETRAMNFCFDEKVWISIKILLKSFSKDAIDS